MPAAPTPRTARIKEPLEPLAASTVAPSSRLSGPERRLQLLDVTAELVVDEGFSAVSIKAVADRAGITRPIVYEHFGDLGGLLAAVIDRETTRARDQLAETAVGELTRGSVRELLVDSLAGYLDAVRSHPTTWRLVLMPPEGAPASLRESIEVGRRGALARLADAIRPALVGEGGEVDAELTAHVLSSMADEYARLVLSDPDRFPPERLRDHADWLLGRLALDG